MEDFNETNKELIAKVASLIKVISFWAPMLAAGAAGSMVTNRDFTAFIGQLVNAVI